MSGAEGQAPLTLGPLLFPYLLHVQTQLTRLKGRILASDILFQPFSIFKFCLRVRATGRRQPAESMQVQVLVQASKT